MHPAGPWPASADSSAGVETPKVDRNSGSQCGPVIVNSPDAIASLDYYKSLLAYSPPDSLNYFWDDVMALIQQAKVAELIMWNDATYAVSVDETASTVVGKVGLDIVPQGKGGQIGQLEGWTYLIPAYSQSPQAAYLFIQWMMGHDRQLEQHGVTCLRRLDRRKAS